MNKAERIAYGEDVAYALYNSLKRDLKGEVRRSDSYSEWTPYFDLLNGDIFILANKIIKIDVKRINKNGKVFISYKSATLFRGNYFALSDLSDVEKTVFMDARSIKTYMLKVEKDGNLEIPFEDPGYYFDPTKLHKAIKYENFVNRINNLWIP
jgi:hypothetical protein